MSSGDFSSQSLPSDASGQAIEMTNSLKQIDDLFYRYSLGKSSNMRNSNLKIKYGCSRKIKRQKVQ